MRRPSLGRADRAVLERADGCQPANRGRIDIVGPGHIGLRLACGEALDSRLPLMGRHLAWTPEAHAALLGAQRPSPVRARISSRSNSAKPPSTVNISRPCGLVVSAQASLSDLKPAP